MLFKIFVFIYIYIRSINVRNYQVLTMNNIPEKFSTLKYYSILHYSDIFRLCFTYGRLQSREISKTITCFKFL